ncbi:MSC_0619 family F1-like ATPase alpha subunit [Mycoplasma sp. CSL7503-lung]|uniref:MSC_0619 family F1-like ATPase alpha subunit n=1 Tax=Mycoplasma sp. CSL7503-lung TaxID=536372 RepID=UPI0021CE4743|nr:ATP F0F1 synthase subunit alpha [Mycoplasma sp. CSL7503-lung]MCU4706425.1 ATP F0F1 synthase subunit alpha [Mycoplasma sp. CSL7503-lung]
MINNPKITSIFDYIVEVSGEFPYKQRQFYSLKENSEVKLMLISATKNKAFLIANTKNTQLRINAEIVLENNEASVYTYHSYFGKVIDIEGNIILPTKQRNNLVPNEGQSSAKIFELAHDLMTVKTLNEQLFTGIIPIDLLIPIGKGQRELIIGDRQTGKTHIALNTIINQARNGVKCIYVAIGQKREAISKIYNTLSENQALSNTIIIDAPSTSAYEQYLAPYIGMAHAENLSKTHDVLIVFDDLTKHANIIREIALLTDRPVGKEAMPGDTFFSHSQLLERSGSFIGRKTITALPILQTVDGDITSLIASNIISITDGQVVTSADLFSQGVLPAININLSVSRTGSSVQSRQVTKIAAEVGKIYKQYKRHLKLAMLDYDFNKETSMLIYKGKTIDKMFQQRGFTLYKQELILFTSKLVSWTILKGISNEDLAMKFLNKFIVENQEAKENYNRIINGLSYDDNLVKSFFASALKQFSDYNSLEWDIDNEYDFVGLDEAYLDKISRELKVKEANGGK